jgi:60 kDa SS-A/Ro ribonucleoprotein
MNYARHVQNKVTPQSEPASPLQKANSAGGFSFEVDEWKRFDRFLVLGSEKGTYYIDERKLTKDNATNVLKLIKKDGKRVVETIVAVSDAGRAPKNDPAIFALALAVAEGDDATKRLALQALPKVCRIGTHLFQFAEAIEQLSGWGPSKRKAFSRWYMEKDADALALQLIKYQSRNGWSHKDIFRKAHTHKISFADKGVQALIRWVIDRENFEGSRQVVRHKEKSDPVTMVYEGFKKKDLPKIIGAFEKAMTLKEPSDAGELAKLIREFRLPRECIPTEALGSKPVWEALLGSVEHHMPMTAMIRNLGKMTSVGILGDFSEAEKIVLSALEDREGLKKARVHPLNMLVAFKTYSQGHGEKGNLSWKPNRRICDALDAAMYTLFEVMEPTGKRHYLGVDYSGSMDANIAGMPLSCREAAAVMAMVIAKVEKQSVIYGFSTHMVDLGITARQNLDTVLKKMNNWPGGGTDCALPMIHALKEKTPVDAFIVITDSETWHGAIHPHQALKQYRDKTGIPAKEVVIGMTANDFTIADPNDAGTLDVCGFDTTVPAVIADFVRG